MLTYPVLPVEVIGTVAASSSPPFNINRKTSFFAIRRLISLGRPTTPVRRCASQPYPPMSATPPSAGLPGHSASSDSPTPPQPSAPPSEVPLKILEDIAKAGNENVEAQAQLSAGANMPKENETEA